MTPGYPFAQVWRGDMIESVHFGHAVVANAAGQVVAQWGDPQQEIYPRSSAKLLQALPMVESGAADALGLGAEHLALACASHNGAPMHVDRVSAWLGDLGLDEHALICGTEPPRIAADRAELRAQGAPLSRLHNNCSGKHAGFLSFAQYLGAGPDYVDPDHPVQHAVRDAFEEMTGGPSPRFGIDGCSAPNFATTLTGLARAMAKMAAPSADLRGKAAARLVESMAANPLLVAGEGRACSNLISAMDGDVVKTGAEGVFVAILPSRGLGIALKASDGATRAAEAAIAAVLVGAGALAAEHPAAQSLMSKDIRNWDGLVTGKIVAQADLAKPI